MGIFSGLMSLGSAKANRLGIKARQLTGKIAFQEGRERQELKNAAIDLLGERNLSSQKMQIIGRLIPLVRNEPAAVAQTQRFVQQEEAEMAPMVNLLRMVQSAEQSGMSQQQKLQMRNILLQEERYESIEEALAMQAVQKSGILVANLKQQRAELVALLKMLNSQIRDLKLESREEKKTEKVNKVEQKEESEMTSFFEQMPASR